MLCLLALQIDANSKYQERVRKAIAARPRNAITGAASAAREGSNVDAAEADVASQSQAAGGEADDADNSAAAQPQPAVVRASPAVNPPERWSDVHMHWRHPLFFVFYLNGPLTAWHPHPGSRQVCELLKKCPRSGPASLAGARIVSSDDSRSSQRAAAREDDRRAVDDRNDSLIQQLRASRCAHHYTTPSHIIFIINLLGKPKPKLSMSTQR